MLIAFSVVTNRLLGLPFESQSVRTNQRDKMTFEISRRDLITKAAVVAAAGSAPLSADVSKQATAIVSKIK